MPTLPNRTAHEQSIESAIAAEYAKLRTQAAKNPAGVSWTDSEDQAQRDLADELATVYLLALSQLSKQSGQDFNQFVAVALATDYANTRAAEVVSNLYDDLRAKVNDASRTAASSVANGILAETAKQRYEQELPRIFDPFRPATIGVTEVTAAISAGEYAVGKPDKDKWWLALILLYGLPDALEAWRNRQPGQTIRDLIGRPRLPGRRDVIEPAPGGWPVTTPRRELPKEPQLPSQLPGQSSDQPISSPTGPGEQDPSQPTAPQTPVPRGPDAPSQTPPTIPSVLMPYWQTEGDAAVCSICSPLDGLAEDKYWTRFPGGPPAHPNCRCLLRWVPGEDLES